METKDEIRRRIDEAAQFAPPDQFCVSPQCGFSSTVHGNEIHVETQAAKIRLCVDVAREVWGGV
jgi:5-methyltetrahydropteroyltriglutamate--homocysteine methyltransferase